ncbi:MAG: adenosylcobinamide-GDP ribazoletransferase [Clostridiales bacterium]|nr:adenosylcobinamide-GDP ribazoletransferase [Clostridiales bacterium]
MKKIFSALSMAVGMYTVLPVPLKRWDDKARTLMLMFLPFAGLVIGAGWYALARLMCLAAFPEAAYAAVLTIYPYKITGFLHLDGFMDCCDAILSCRSDEEKRRILKDPHVGSFAVISLAVLLLVCFSCSLSWREAPVEALIFVPVCSRCVSALCIFAMKPMEHSQFAGDFEKEKRKSYGWIMSAVLAAALACAFALKGSKAGLPSAAAAAGCFLGILYARRNLGGMSGDIAGYGTVVGEAAAFAAMIIAV